MLKNYFTWSLIAFLMALVGGIFGLTGASLGAGAFLALTTFLVLLGCYRPRQLFWLFLSFLALENATISPEILPFQLRLFQLAGIVLVIITLAMWLVKKSPIKMLSFKKICLICNLINKEGCQKISRRDAFNNLDKMVFLFIFLGFLSIINAVDRMVAFKFALILISFGLFYWLVRNYLRKRRHYLEALWFFLLGAEVSILLAIYQSLAVKIGLESFSVMAGRVNSTFTEPDWLGMFLVFVTALLLWGKLSVGNFGGKINLGRWDFRRTIQWIINLGVFACIFVLILTVSRSAWVGFTAVSFAYFVLGMAMTYRKNIFCFDRKILVKEVSIFIGMIIMAFLLVGWAGLSEFHFGNRAVSSLSGMQKITVSCTVGSQPPAKIENINQLENYNCYHINLEEIEKEKAMGFKVYETYRPDPNVEIRKNIYVVTWQEIKKHPWLGQGLGNSALILGSDERGAGLNASNVFLEVWFSTGLIGLLLFLLIFFSPLYLAYKNYLDEIDPVLIRHRNFIILTTLALLIPNLFNAGLFLGFFWVWLAVLAGLIHFKN